ncbi:MAG: DNA polymerase I, partial [bacterium]
MAGQMSLLKDIVRAFNIPLLELSGYEADDIIGTLALRAEKERVITFMVTGDKDFMQLITPYIKILRPGKGGDDPEVIDERHVLEKFGVAPGQVTDVLGLIGDKSDNVPGVSGIGEKTAIPLIQQYGSMEQLYENIENIGQRGVREKLIKNKELAFLSKKLVTIDTDVPVEIDFHKLKAAPPDTATLARMFGELEFRSLANKLGNVVQAVIETQVKPVDAISPLHENASDIRSDEHEYSTITSAEALDRFLKQLKSAKIFSLQTVTTSAIAMQAEIIGLSFSLKEREAFYIPIRQDSTSTSGFPAGDLFSALPSESAASSSPALPLAIVFSRLKPILEDPAIKKVGHNLKYSMLVLSQHDIEMQGVEFDTMVASYVLRADGQHERDAIAMECLNHKITTYEDLVGKGKSLKHITELPLESVAQYAAEDADITLRIYNCQILKLKEMEQLKLCEDVEFPLVSVLARMESEGIALDVPYLADMAKDLARQLENLVGDIYNDAGERFNINSTQQLGEILFNKLKLPTVRKTKTGFSTDAGVLEALRGQHAIIDRMLEYRQLSKLKSTYVDALPLLINPKTNRIHTSFNQTVALTGRLSGADPNLQNIPIRTELGQAIRKAFIPGKKNNSILSADYSQIELRVMAHISSDEGLLEAFNNNEDIHTSTAAKVFGVQGADISRDMRR